LLACTRILFFVGTNIFFHQQLTLPFSPCHTNTNDCNYTHCICAYVTSLLRDQSGNCIRTKICLHTVC
jgi:hypothetical protein